jgi:hypothetical protein
MNKIIFILLLMSFGICFAQINVEEIKKNVTENPQKYYLDYLAIFKKNPSELNQEQMNQLYYGSRFIDTGYSLSNYNKDYDKVWKIASRRGLSKGKAQKIINKAEEAYSKNPFEREILTGVANLYIALGETAKSNICISQSTAIEETIKKSGTGKSEDSPICVIRAGDMMSGIKDLMTNGMIRDFNSKEKFLPDGSMLSIYSIGDQKIYLKLVGGFR